MTYAILNFQFLQGAIFLIQVFFKETILSTFPFIPLSNPAES